MRQTINETENHQSDPNQSNSICNSPSKIETIKNIMIDKIQTLQAWCILRLGLLSHILKMFHFPLVLELLLLLSSFSI